MFLILSYDTIMNESTILLVRNNHAHYQTQNHWNFKDSKNDGWKSCRRE